MFKHNLAYRFSNGEVEGFTGFGFSKEQARINAIQKVGKKLDLLSDMLGKQTFTESSVIESDKGLTAAERAQIRKDWKVSEKSNLC